MDRLRDTQGLADCISAHTLIEVGETNEAIDFCLSVLHQPVKTLSGLQTQAYLTILIACIDENADQGAQLKKARNLWHRIKKKNDNSYEVPAETREISKKDTEMKWRRVMDSLDDTEAHFKQEIEAAKLPLENKVTVLENDLLVSQGRITLLQDESKIKQEKIDILQAEVALLKSKPSSEYTDLSVIKHETPPTWTIPWPLSLCLSPYYPDPADFNMPIVESPFTHRHSMILDNKNLTRYSTSAQVMTCNKKSSAPEDTTSGHVSPPAETPPSDLERLMMNGPILVRPGRPLAYVDDAGNIVEVECDIADLPPMMFPHPDLNQAASATSLSAGRHKSTRF